MNNVEPHSSEKPPASNQSNSPLIDNIISPPTNNAALQIVENVSPQNENAALHTSNFNPPSESQTEMPEIYPASAKNNYSINSASSNVENEALHLLENEASHLQENEALHSNENEALRLQENEALHPQKNFDQPENSNVVPQWEENAGLANSAEIENVVLHQKEKVEFQSISTLEQRTNENVDTPISAKPVRSKKARPKKSVKKVYSQKRNVVPLKLFVSPAEKIDLEDKAAKTGCSLSNFIRTGLGLAPNETGRKKRHTESAIDLSELGLDFDFKDSDFKD